MKIAPVLRAIKKRSSIIPIVVHTGQHYDQAMSDTFFNSLNIQAPDYNLEAGSGSHAVQTANIMTRFEEVCLKERPDGVIVVGDVNSTIAAGLVAKKMHITLAHIEAGLRSRDRDMPEEINRLATDAITDIFFTTEEKGTANLAAEGHSDNCIHFVGHVMIDNLFYQLKKVEAQPPPAQLASIKARVKDGKYICMTMHRPSNVDTKPVLERLAGAIWNIAQDIPVFFPCHPRTRQNISEFGLEDKFSFAVPDNGEPVKNGIYILDPLGYNEFLYLWKDAALVLTDSGGLQEETTALQIPCITMRENTERPVTVSAGTNEIAGTDPAKIEELAKKALTGNWKKGTIPPLWDGQASERIAAVLATIPPA